MSKRSIKLEVALAILPAGLTQKNPKHEKIAMAVVTAFMNLSMPDPNREGTKVHRI